MPCDFERIHHDVLQMAKWLSKSSVIPPDIMNDVQSKLDIVLAQNRFLGKSAALLSSKEIDDIRAVSLAADKVLNRVEHDVELLSKPMNELLDITEPLVKVKYYADDAVRSAKTCSEFVVPIQYRGFI